jgi:hypothetical protein
MDLAADNADGQARIAAFQQGLQQLGWSGGGNLQIDYRWSAGNADNFRRHATELVALAPDVVLANGSPAVAALQQATRTVPIVFATVIDPVAPASSRAWRVLAATPPVSQCSNTASAGNGWSCSSRSRQA